jgi:PAS domain S-box-containing protein
MNEQPGYDELLKQYRDLQLRVTRFSATEQELINTRDRLDHELVLNQRLHRYNSDALQQTSDTTFFQIEAEAIVDVFEMEGSIIIYAPTDTSSPLIYREGLYIPPDLNSFLLETRLLAQKMAHEKNSLLKTTILNQWDFYSQFDQGLFSHFSEPDLGYEVFILGLTSKTNSPLYSAPQERHDTLFGVFTQQLQAMLANRKRSDEISKQIEQIKASQQELRKLSLIATRTKSGVIISDKMGRIEWINDAFTNISGYSLDQVIGKKPKDLLQGPKSDPVVIQKLKESLWNKENIEVEVLNYNHEGQEYYSQLEIMSVFDENGEHTNFIALQKDITSDMLAKQEILRMNTRFELIAKQSRIGTWEYKLTDGSIRWSDIMYDIYGVLKDTTMPIAQIWRDSMSLEDYEQVVADMNFLRHGNQTTRETSYSIERINDGAKRDLEIVMVAERDENGALLRVVGSTKDVTEEIALRRERDASAERMLTIKTFYESILNHSPSQKYVFDSEGSLLFSSEPAKEGALWWDPHSRKSIFELADSESNARAMHLINSIRRAIETKQIVRTEDEGELADGTKVDFLQSILPYQNATGKLEHIIVTGVDITELKTVQDAVNKKNDELRKINSELDNFVYSISHDLRSPLLSIKGIVSLIIHSSEIDEKNRMYLEMVDGSASRLDGTIQEILEYSRNSRLEIEHENFDVVELVQQAFNDLRFSSQGEMELVLDIQTSTRINSDRSRVSVLLKNIIGNSVKYRRKGMQSFVKFSLKREHNQIVMQVSDNGEGIDEKHLSQIFTMFFRGTTSSVGTGLGLYICKEIANKLKGDLFVASKLGEGTSMKITIPEDTYHE